jgi:hypothetical protein
MEPLPITANSRHHLSTLYYNFWAEQGSEQASAYLSYEASPDISLLRWPCGAVELAHASNDERI